jgi:hypothetical protein
MYWEPFWVLSFGFGCAVFIWPERAAWIFRHRTESETPARLRSPRYLRFLGALWALVALFLLIWEVNGRGLR